MLLYSRPGAWADIFVTRTFFDSTGRDILLNSVRLEMIYDFLPRNNLLGRRTLEIIPAGVELPPAGQLAAAAVEEPIIVHTGMLPLFIVDKPDVDQRRHGRGAFLRTYQTQAGLVAITAPANYGEWQFHQWADRFGRPVVGASTPTIQVSMSNDAALMAQYIRLVTVPLLHAPSVQGSNIVLQWEGGSNIYLQTTVTLNGSWSDVPGTAGLSQFTLPLGGNSAFFRVVRR
jgi:hypothetical protein